MFEDAGGGGGAYGGGGRRRRRRRRADWWDKQDFLRVCPGEKEGFAKSAGENVVKKIQRNLSILSSAYLEGEGGGAINLENFLLRLLGDSQVEGRGGRKGGSGARWGGGDITIGAFRLLLLLLRRPACRLDGVTAWTKKKIRGNDFVLDERVERGGGGMIWTRQNGGGGGGAVASVLNGMGGGESSLLLFFRIRAHDKRDIFAQWRRRRRRAGEKGGGKNIYLCRATERRLDFMPLMIDRRWY